MSFSPSKTSLFFLLFLFSLLLLLAPTSAMAATIEVNSTLDNTFGGDAFCTLREAINNANAGADTTTSDCTAGTAGADTITFAAATNGVPIVITGASGNDDNSSGDFDITKPVTITGNGEATTIIDGGGLDRVFHVTAAVAVTFEKLTIRNGKLSSLVCPLGCGGGVFSLGDLSFNTVTLSGNTAFGSAGILSNGALTMTNSTVTNNSASVFGGFRGIGATVIASSTISNNKALLHYGGFFSDTTVTLTNSTVTNNTATNGICGGFFANGALTINSSTISNNRASGYCGGIFAQSTTTMTDSTISGNIAQNGAGIWASQAVTIDNSTISGNQSTVWNAGGLYTGAGGTITNSTISGNSAASKGGGIVNDSNALSLVNTTLYGNSAPTGGGIYTFAGAITLSNTIVANNTGGGGADCHNIGATWNGGDFNIDSDGSCVALDTGAGGGANDITDAAFTLPALANNGGTTLTHSPAGTIAENANTTCANASATSQNGVARPGGSGCDIGSVEIAVVAAKKKKKNKAPIYDPDGDGEHNGDEDWLVFPSVAAHENANVVFIWKALTDPEGTEVTYQLYVCKDGDFDNCTPTHVTHTARYAGAAGAALGAGLLIFGLGFTRSGRRSMVALALALLLMTGSGALVACGGSDNSSDSGGTSTPLTCDDASDDEVCQTSLSLEPGDYQWMVIAEDDNGKQMSSGTRELTVE